MYTTISNLNQHLVKHGPKTEVCQLCGKAFHLKASLRSHVSCTHQDQATCPCNICGLTMKNKNSLTTHMKMFHAGVQEM